MNQKPIWPCCVAPKCASSGCVFMLMCVALGWTETSRAEKPSFELKVEQVTFGPKHHFFGYIGQCRTIPWNVSGRYIVGMEIDRIDKGSYGGNIRIDPAPRWNRTNDAILVPGIAKDQTRQMSIIRISATDGSSPGNMP